MQFIDLHGHYAWDIDDGIPSKEEALAALEIASKNNIITIAAYNPWFPYTRRD